MVNLTCIKRIKDKENYNRCKKSVASIVISQVVSDNFWMLILENFPLIYLSAIMI